MSYDIVGAISRYIKLTKDGGIFIGRCPICGEGNLNVDAVALSDAKSLKRRYRSATIVKTTGRKRTVIKGVK